MLGTPTSGSYNPRMFFSKPSAPLKDSMQEEAAQLLLTPTALADMSEGDARTVTRFMQLKRVPADAVFIREGESGENDFMMLILEGEVAVENEVVPVEASMVISIMGPGNLIGEMGLMDGAPRSATCTAHSDLKVAVLTRDGLAQLINKNPAVAARFLLAISKRLSDRLREANRKVKTFAGLSRALQGELDAVHARRKPAL